MHPEGVEKIELAPEQFPFHSWALPTFSYPGIVVTYPLSVVTSEDRFRASVGLIDAETALAFGGGTRSVKAPQMVYHQQKFTRFLAKIAHGYACAMLGQKSFPPILSKFICFGEGESRMFVGGETVLEPRRSTVFEIALGIVLRPDGTEFLAVKIRLLAYLGTPTYWVVVGSDFQGDLKELGVFAYQKEIKITIVDQDGVPIFVSGD